MVATVILIALIGTYIFSKRCSLKRHQLLTKLVADLGPPDFVVTNAGFSQPDKVLELIVDQQDPLMVTDWNSVKSKIGIWGGSIDFKRKADYFYHSMRDKHYDTDFEFKGKAWYSSVPLFGEKLTIRWIDNTGVVTKCRTIRVSDVSIYIEDTAPRVVKQSSME